MFNLYLRNLHLLWPDAVKEARLYVDPPGGAFQPPENSSAPYVTSSDLGVASLDVSKLSPGVHRVWIVPKHANIDPVGPRTAIGLEVPRIFRPLQIHFTVGNRNDVISAAAQSATNGYGEIGPVVNKGSNQELVVRLRPIWAKAGYHPKRTQKIDMIVIHKTGDPDIGPAINTFLGKTASAHYVVGRDGHIVKMVLDEHVAGHASNENSHNQSHWGTQTGLSGRSIGIENVGTVKQEFTSNQYASLIRLIQELMSTHGIPRHRVLAHSDILTNGSGHLSDERIACPGHQFDWPQFENAKPPIGLARTGGNASKDPVAYFFHVMSNGMLLMGEPPLVLKPGDFDPRMVGGKLQPCRLGGRVFKDIEITPITHLQTWLAEIGYSVGTADGQFNQRMARAVKHFQVHFENRNDNDRVNAQTAALIRAVRDANPKAD
jgi:N-acetyl-anhydromuramyl-L-alanine amidase AmpD